jgi:RhoGEF domain
MWGRRSVTSATCDRAIVENRQIISTEEIDAIFGSIGNILSVNAELLQSLERNVCRSLDARLSSSVSDAFIKLMPFFRTYNEYCNNFWTASIRLRDISDANSAFHGFLRVRTLAVVHNMLLRNQPSLVWVFSIATSALKRKEWIWRLC